MTIALELLRRFWPYLVAFVVGFSAAWGFQGMRLDNAKKDLLVLETSVKTLGDQAKIDKERVEQERDANLVKVETYEKSLPDVRSNAVAAYKLRYPNTCRSGVSKPTTRKQVDDGTTKEPVAPGSAESATFITESTFIEDSADDANKLAAWQAWAILNDIPVK